MDVPRKRLHYRNMNSIPIYALYGETESQHDWLHWETIQSRSRLHDYEIAPHRHEALYQILSLTGGRATAILDGARFALAPPAVVTVPALTVHAYEFSEDVEGTVVTLMERDLGGLGIAIPEAGVTPGSEVIAAAQAGLILEADNPGAAHDAAMRAHLTLLLVALARARQHTGPTHEGADRALAHARAFRLAVEQRFRQTRRLADYAGAVGISTTHLNRVCREVMGATALEVIEKRIALEARRQLLFSSLTIKQIGAELGYDDPAYFSRFVTRMLGMAPGAFRHAGRTPPVSVSPKA